MSEGALPTRPLVIGIIAGESSGDQLGSRLMRALAERAGAPIRFVGVGGPLMLEEGLTPLFPMADIAVNGLIPVIRRLPLLLRRIRDACGWQSPGETRCRRAYRCAGFQPEGGGAAAADVPGRAADRLCFAHRWAWRPGRARKIARLYSRLMAILPFEPAVHARLGGPPTTYVGHPLMERLADFTPNSEEAALRAGGPMQSCCCRAAGRRRSRASFRSSAKRRSGCAAASPR